MGGIATLAIASIQSTQAATVVNFTNLSSGDGIGNNSLQVDGSSANLTVAQSLVGGDYLYAISYSGLDLDGVAGLDTLNFTVRVDSRRNGTIAYGAGNTSTATLGATSRDVSLSTGSNPSAWVNQTDVMLGNSSLIFTVESATISTRQSVDNVSFTGLFMEESRGGGHQTVIGLGTGLPGYEYGADQAISVSPGVSTLYVSNGLGANDAVGVRDLDFSITVSSIPEPSSAALLGLGGLSLILRRRK